MSHGDLTVLHLLYFSIHNDINCRTFRIIFKLFPIYLYRKRKLYNYNRYHVYCIYKFNYKG